MLEGSGIVPISPGAARGILGVFHVERTTNPAAAGPPGCFSVSRETDLECGDLSPFSDVDRVSVALKTN